MKKVLFITVLILCAVLSGHAQTIRNTRNSAVATIDDKGTVRNTGNSCLGKIESDGKIRDCNNHLLGKVESDGDVRDSNNHLLGTAKGVPPQYAALFFFFHLF